MINVVLMQLTKSRQDKQSLEQERSVIYGRLNQTKYLGNTNESYQVPNTALHNN